MTNVEILVTRIKYALESVDDKEQELIVDHIEQYAARVNSDNPRILKQVKSGDKNVEKSKH